jgi:hypothetical protein
VRQAGVSVRAHGSEPLGESLREAETSEPSVLSVSICSYVSHGSALFDDGLGLLKVEHR